jgi:ATP-dependent Clp protease protease subunit
MTIRPDESDLLTERLLALRTVLISGPMETERATRYAAMLLTLEAESRKSIAVRLHSSGGELEPALMLADTIDLLKAPVEITCVAEVSGAALALLTATDHRAATAHARFHLVEPRPALPPGPGRATEVATIAEAHEHLLDRFATRLAATTGRSAGDVRSVLAPPGRVLDAETALEWGLINSIVTSAR